MAWRSGVEGTWCPAVHATCPHNELAALCQRVLAPLPPPVFAPVGSGVAAAFRRLRTIARAYGGGTWSYLETAQSYSGMLGRRYLEAERSLRLDSPLGYRDFKLSPFLKAEKLNALAKLPKPRLIWPRSPRYNLVIASRLKPFEHWLWGYLTARRLFNGSGTRVVAKGLNPRQRANLIVRKFRSFQDCVVFEVDGKAFEAHVGPHQLKGEHSVYRAAFPGDRKLARLLEAQSDLTARLPCGAKFSRQGGRASGDFNTGMGNSLIMLAVVVAALQALCQEFDVLVDGDNALVFLPGAVAPAVVGGFAQEVLRNSGHEVTLERPVRVIEEIRFGRSAPVMLGAGRGWCMVREWTSVLSGALCSHRWLRLPGFSREWLTGVAMCELSLSRGVPVLQAWALNAIKTLGFRKVVRAHPHKDYFQVGAWLAEDSAAITILPEARESFERAFGLAPDAQRAMEVSFGPVAPEGAVEIPPPRSLDSCPPGVAESWYDASF